MCHLNNIYSYGFLYTHTTFLLVQWQPNTFTTYEHDDDYELNFHSIFFHTFVAIIIIIIVVFIQSNCHSGMVMTFFCFVSYSWNFIFFDCQKQVQWPSIITSECCCSRFIKVFIFFSSSWMNKEPKKEIKKGNEPYHISTSLESIDKQG